MARALPLRMQRAKCFVDPVTAHLQSPMIFLGLIGDRLRSTEERALKGDEIQP